MTSEIFQWVKQREDELIKEELTAVLGKAPNAFDMQQITTDQDEIFEGGIIKSVKYDSELIGWITVVFEPEAVEISFEPVE